MSQIRHHFGRCVIPPAELTSRYVPECVLIAWRPCRDFARVACTDTGATATQPLSVRTEVDAGQIIGTLGGHCAEALSSASAAPPGTGRDHYWWPTVNDNVPPGAFVEASVAQESRDVDTSDRVEARRPVCVLVCPCVHSAPAAGR